MRLPGDAVAVGADRDRSNAEDDVDAEPDREKAEHARVAKGAQQRKRRYARRRIGDLAKAADSIGWGIFYNSGQTCNAGSRLIVHRSVREELVERYERQSGRSMTDIRWYQTLALWKSIVFMEGNYKRAVSGATDDPFLKQFGEGVLELARRAEAVALGD